MNTTTVIKIVADDHVGRIYLAYGAYVLQYSPDKNTFSALYVGKSPITRAMAISPIEGLVAIIDMDKNIQLLNASGQAKKRGKLEKGAMCAVFANDSTLLVGDKFGDIIQFSSKENSDLDRQTIAGGVSIVTELLLWKDYILMGDRDEKIRLINLKFPFIIERFLLEHTEYVAAMGLLGEDRLISFGGEGQAILWDLSNGKVTHSIGVMKNKSLLGIAISDERIAYIYHGDNQVHFLKYQNDRLLEDTSFHLPNGFEPTAIACCNGIFYLAGSSISENKPFLASLAELQLTMIESFCEFIEKECLPPSTNPKSDLSLLRKRRFTDNKDTDHNTYRADRNDSEERSGSELE